MSGEYFVFALYGQRVLVRANDSDKRHPNRHLTGVSSMNPLQTPPLYQFKEIHKQDRRRHVREAIPAANNRNNPLFPRRVERLQALGGVSDALRQAATGEVAETALVGDDALAVVHAQDSAKEFNRRALEIVDALLRGDHHLLHGHEVSAQRP